MNDVYRFRRNTGSKTPKYSLGELAVVLNTTYGNLLAFYNYHADDPNRPKPAMTKTLTRRNHTRVVSVFEKEPFVAWYYATKRGTAQ